MAWAYRKNAKHSNPKKDAVRKAVCNKTKTKNEMAGWRVHGPENDGYKRMERQSKGPRDLEAYCRGGQGPPQAVAPTDDDEERLVHVYDWRNLKLLNLQPAERTEENNDVNIVIVCSDTKRQMNSVHYHKLTLTRLTEKFLHFMERVFTTMLEHCDPVSLFTA